MPNYAEAIKKTQELELLVGGLNGSADDLVAVGIALAELKAALK